MGLFDVFKDKDEDSDDGGTTEEYRAKILHLVIHQSLNQLKKQKVTRPPLLNSLLKKQPHIHKLKLQDKVRLE